MSLFSSATGGCFRRVWFLSPGTGGNNRIRNITFNEQTQSVAPANLQLNTYPGVQITGSIGRTYQIQSSPDMNTWKYRGHRAAQLQSLPVD